MNSQNASPPPPKTYSKMRPPPPPPSLDFSKYQKTILQLHNTQSTVPKIFIITHYYLKAVPLQAWSGSEGSGKLRFPDYMTTAQDGGKVVSPTHRPPLPPGNAPGTHFCYRLSRPQGHSAIGRIMSKKNSSDTIWDRTNDLPICSTAH